MKIRYQASSYTPELVTGKYVRCDGRKGAYRFITFETATCMQRGPHYRKAGYGYTLREYETDGSELPEDFRDLCIRSKNMERLS